MESRKRPFSDEEDTTATKKRVLTSANGSPQVNGVHTEQEEPVPGDNLELFRKEALFRRMRYYSREAERNQSRIAELEQRKNTCEAGLAAISACWTQLIETIRLLVNPEDLPLVKVDSQDIFDLTVQIQNDLKPDLETALEDNMNATRTLVTKFVQLGGQSQSNFRCGDSYPECQKMTTECNSLRGQMEVLRSRLKDSDMQKDRYYSALVAAEGRIDRLRSGTALVIRTRAVAENQELTGEAIEESQQKPSSPASGTTPVQDNGIHEKSELQVCQELLRSRDAKVGVLEKDVSALRDDKMILELGSKSLLYEQIAKNPHYTILLDHASVLEAELKEARSHVTSLLGEIGDLRASRKEWEESVITSAGQANQELKTMLARRDAENARLRDQREQQAAELNERKHKDNVKLTSLQELKALADSRSDRIVALESELCRVKARLAANTGDKDLTMFFAGGQLESTVYIQSLKDRVTVAENRAAAFEQTLSIFQDDHPNVVEHMRAEADARQKLSEVTSQLEEYQATYGDPSTLPPDISRLAERLHEKEEEIQKLRLVDTQRDQAETSLYVELDKLSAAWESLDRQIKSKVFDLTSIEDRLIKSGLDRAKSENKFYAAMRDKEAIENERKNIARNIEKQAKLVERLVESERNLTGQLGVLEKELTVLKRVSEEHKARADHMNSEIRLWQARAEGEKQKRSVVQTLLKEKEHTLFANNAELRKLEDGLIRLRKEMEHHTSKLKSPVPGQQTATETQNLLDILKCSTCKLQFRSVVITKCMHTFCKQCVDDRITTRQRKCPACNLPFAQSDVTGLFFQ